MNVARTLRIANARTQACFMRPVTVADGISSYAFATNLGNFRTTEINLTSSFPTTSVIEKEEVKFVDVLGNIVSQCH